MPVGRVTMKIISWNVNGIRAILKTGFWEWFEKTKADFYCLQETKAQPEQISPSLFMPKNYFSFFNSAAKKGYSGVAVYTKIPPLSIELKIGFKRFDNEGRFLKLNYKNFALINIYLPHGGRGKENLGYKLEAYDSLLRYLEKLKNQNVILIGDFNIAHQEIDLARPEQNKNNIMFTPEERKQIDKLIKLGFIDTFRKFHKDGGHYTWWPYSANARQRNLGWRIDYVFVSKSLLPKLKNAFILQEITGSDHCPIGIRLTF